MALHVVVPRFVVIVLREIIFVVPAFKEVQISAARFRALMWWKLLRWIMAISVCAVMHQYAPFQVTNIGGLGRDVSHACQLTRGCLDPLIHPTCPWCLSTTQLTMGGRKRTASYFQFGPRCLSPRMCSTCMWSALARLPALSANAWRQSWSVHISASAHAKSSWTRTISNTNMYIGAWLFFIECILHWLFSSSCASIYEEVQIVA